MIEEPAPGGSAWVFKEIKTLPPDRPYRFRSITFLTYATLGAVGLNGCALLLQLVALGGQWGVLARMSGNVSAADDVVSAAHASDALVGAAAILTLLTLVLAYVIAGFWIYNAACNTRALGASGLQNTPGWAVGWYAVPVASLFKPFQAMAEIYQASASPVGWQRLKTPALLRFWWGAWLLAGVTGYGVAVVSRSMSEIPDLIGVTQFQMADLVVDLVASALFAIVVLRVYRAQVLGQSQIGQVAQVFS